MERGGDDYREYKRAVKMAKEAIDTICDLTADMESEYGYGERHSSHYRHDDWDGMDERRRRR